jgi:hypothetical protein
MEFNEKVPGLPGTFLEGCVKGGSRLKKPGNSFKREIRL